MRSFKLIPTAVLFAFMTIVVASCSEDPTSPPSALTNLRIDSVSPAVAFAGDTIRVFGSGLSGESILMVGKDTVGYVLTDHVLSFILPEGSPGDVIMIFLQGEDERRIDGRLKILQDHVIHSVQPYPAKFGGEITIGLEQVPADVNGLIASLNGLPLSITSRSGNTLVVKLDDDARTGNLKLESPNGVTRTAFRLEVQNAEQYESCSFSVSLLSNEHINAYNSNHPEGTYTKDIVTRLTVGHSEMRSKSLSTSTVYEFAGTSTTVPERWSATVEIEPSRLKISYSYQSIDIYKEPWQSTSGYSTSVTSNWIPYTRAGNGDIDISIDGAAVVPFIASASDSHHSESPLSAQAEKSSYSSNKSAPTTPSSEDKLVIHLKKAP
jgi:hypothetical protein